MPVNRLSKSFTSDPKTMPLGTYIGFVKRNDDAQRMGRLSVFIPELGGDPIDPGAWVIVSYASPFAGATDPNSIQQSSQTMAGSQQSYGFWMVPPDLNNEVAVFFANGDISRGYWFACCYQTNMNHMVPGLAINVTTDNPPAVAPVVEYNKANVTSTTNPSRPRFDPLADGLLTEGLATDSERGTASTSARREAPSQVFGFLSPRSNTVHIDDNTANEFIRLRTRSGTQVLVNETSGYVYINSKGGNSWLEISDSGVDIYTADSVSIRAELDFNVRADRDITLDAGANIFMRAGSKIGMQAGTEIDGIAGTNIYLQAKNDIQAGAAQNLVISAGANGSLKVGKDFQSNAGQNYRMQAGQEMSQLAGAKQIRAGSTIFDNCNGAPPAVANDAVVPTTREGLMLPDAKPAFAGPNSDQTTWKGGGAQVNTIVGRMPTHEPWRDHPRGDIPPPPTDNVDIVAQPTYDAGASSTTNPDGSITDSGCSTGSSGTKPISTDVYNAITAAASKTGCDPATMFAFADMESSFHPGAAAGTSSASGLYQFTSGTWSAMVTKYGAQYNVPYSGINDASSNALMGGQFIQDNASALKAQGITSPTPGQLYIMHFMGSGGGPKLIKAAQTTPDADASLAFPAAAGANPSVFRGKTCAQVVASLSATADSKAQAYSGQYGLPAPCDRGGSGSPAIPLQGAAATPQSLAGPTTQPPASSADSATNLANMKPNAGGYVGDTQQCVSLVKATAGLGPTSSWSKGSTDITTWSPNQPIAVFDGNGRYGNHTDGSSHAAIFLGIAQTGQHARFTGKPAIRVYDQWAGHPASERIIYSNPSRAVVNNASNYAAINV
jgi:hypothetical protein